jgi:hypothetical protein
MALKFANMNELVNYLELLEKRIQTLETENTDLRSQKDSLKEYIQELSGDAQKLLPKTGLVSSSFIQRAFTVWGHYFVAQLIISVPIVCLYFILMYVLVSQGIEIPTY